MKRRQFLELSGQMAAVAAFSHSSLIKLGSPPPEFGLVIQNGTIINGLGEAAFQADIGISNGKIRFIGRLTGDMSRRATKIIDASGCVVCPGFIDIHSHSGLELLVNPKAESKIRQGVTTELSGNCGGSGLEYTPSGFAEREEIIELCRVVAQQELT